LGDAELSIPRSPARNASCEREALRCAAEVADHDKRKGGKPGTEKAKKNKDPAKFNWSTAISVRSGLQFERPQNFMRKIQLLLEYYNGHSPNGQFFERKIDYIGTGIHLHF
jgi:hypothetical protein